MFERIADFSQIYFPKKRLVLLLFFLGVFFVFIAAVQYLNFSKNSYRGILLAKAPNLLIKQIVLTKIESLASHLGSKKRYPPLQQIQQQLESLAWIEDVKLENQDGYLRVSARFQKVVAISSEYLIFANGSFEKIPAAGIRQASFEYVPKITASPENFALAINLIGFFEQNAKKLGKVVRLEMNNSYSGSIDFSAKKSIIFDSKSLHTPYLKKVLKLALDQKSIPLEKISYFDLRYANAFVVGLQD